MLKWKNVKNLLPNEKTEYTSADIVLFTDGMDIYTGYIKKENEKIEWYTVGYKGHEVLGVTHWMPLPDFPDANNEEEEY